MKIVISQDELGAPVSGVFAGGLVAQPGGQAGALVLPAAINEVTNAAPGTAVVLQSLLGNRQTVFNRSGFGLAIYPATGTAIEGLGTNIPATLADGEDGTWTFDNVAKWLVQIAATGSGGTGAPGGTSGQVQYNQAGVLGGLTISGDATLNSSTGVLTVTKTNGVSFATAAAAAAPVQSVGGRTGVITLAAGDISGFTAAAAAAAPVQSVAARTGAITLTHNDLTDWAAATAGFGAGSSGVSSGAGRTGAVTLTHTDLTDWASATSSFLTSAPVTSVAGRTGVVTLATTDIGGFTAAAAAAAPVQTVAGRAGTVTLTHTDITDWSASQVSGVLALTGVIANGSSVTLPAGAVILQILLIETAGHTVPVSLGTTSGGADIMSAQSLLANDRLPVANLSLTQAAFAGSQTIFLSSAAWAAASVNMRLWYVA